MLAPTHTTVESITIGKFAQIGKTQFQKTKQNPNQQPPPPKQKQNHKQQQPRTKPNQQTKKPPKPQHLKIHVFRNTVIHICTLPLLDEAQNSKIRSK